MDLATAQPHDLRTIAFDYSVEPTLLLDPHADQIIDANPAACTLLGYDRALLRQIKISALHAGQVPALIVFTQAVLAKGSYWTNTLTPRHATGESVAARICGIAWCRRANAPPRAAHHERSRTAPPPPCRRRRRGSTCAAALPRGSGSSACFRTSSARTS